MVQQVADRRDQDFVIWEQMQCEEILKNENYKEFNRKTCDMILTEARALAIKELLPLMAEGDEQGVKYENGTVKVPESFHRVYKLILEGEHKPTQLMYKANISWDVIKDLLALMIKKELITEYTFGKVRRYDITERGIRILSYYQNAVKEIELFC